MFPMLLVALWGLGPDTTLGDDIVAYVRSKLGQKVGNGECTALAVEALRHCDARRPDTVQGIWGDEVKLLRDLQPGDILQFEDAIFVKQHVRGDGALLTLTSHYPHHTAIVARVRKWGPKRCWSSCTRTRARREARTRNSRSSESGRSRWPRSGAGP